MSLFVPTKKKTYKFDGPYVDPANLKEESGVYVITTKSASGQDLYLDVGESRNVRERVTNHDRAECWNAHKQQGVYIWIRYCNEQRRMKAERRIRKSHKPPCGEI